MSHAYTDQEVTMKPSIGRIVHYRLTPDHVLPAIVTSIHGPECVNLRVFTDMDNTRSALDRFAPERGSDGPDPLDSASFLPEFNDGAIPESFFAWSASLGDDVFEWSWPPRV